MASARDAGVFWAADAAMVRARVPVWTAWYTGNILLCSRPNLCRGRVLKAMMPENKDTHTDVPKQEPHDSK